MPTYSYRCTQCNDALEIHQAFADDSLTACPACGGRLRKLFSGLAVTFNGSGFYRTDSRSAKAKETTASGPQSGDASTSKGGGTAGSSDTAASSKPSSRASSPDSGSLSTGSDTASKAAST